MVLNLTQEQAALMQTALQEYHHSLRQQEKYHCAGLSATGISLCQRRLVLDSILCQVEKAEPRVKPSRTSPCETYHIRLRT